MSKKRLLIIVIALLFLGITFYLVGQSRIVTFQEFLDEFLDEDEQVTKIEIRNTAYIQNQEYETIIEDQETIDRILNEPSMKLKKRVFPTHPNFDFENLNIFYIYTNKYKNHRFYLDNTLIHIGRSEYKIIRDNTSYDLMDVIRAEDLEWTGIFN